MAFCMASDCFNELGTNQWIAALLSNVSHNPILLLVWISGIMAATRQFWRYTYSQSQINCYIACFSKYWHLQVSFFLDIPVESWFSLAAAVFALGVAFFWPSMLGFVSENVPTSGALGLAIMGGIVFWEAL